MMIKKSIFKFVNKYRAALCIVAIFVFVAFCSLVWVSVAPSVAPRNLLVKIEKDMTVTEASALLKKMGVIKFAAVYKAYVVFLHRGKGVQAGSYLFDEPQSALRVAYRTAYGVKNIDKVKLTISEGMNSLEIASHIKKQIPEFDSEEFLSRAKENEGYLFPETYFVDRDVGPREIIGMMRDQFDEAIRSLQDDIASTSRSLDDIVIMASIVEEEANNTDDRLVISGILWKRLDEGMPLQVDAPFYYILGKGSSQLTLDELRETGPYNTYTNKGLPIGPISNPGLDALKAALNPKTTPYYFYLADRTGVTHYAISHDGHVANKQKYLQ